MRQMYDEKRPLYKIEQLNDKIIHLLCLKLTGNKALFEKEYKEIKSKISQKLQDYILEY